MTVKYGQIFCRIFHFYAVPPAIFLSFGCTPFSIQIFQLNNPCLHHPFAPSVCTLRLHPLFAPSVCTLRFHPADAACGKVGFCAEYGAGVYYRTRPHRRRSKARDCPRCAAAGSILPENYFFIGMRITRSTAISFGRSSPGIYAGPVKRTLKCTS